MKYSNYLILTVCFLIGTDIVFGCPMIFGSGVREFGNQDDAPSVERVSAVDRNILAVSIIEGTLQRQSLTRYQPEAGDKIKTEDQEVEVVQGGQILREKMTRILQREVDGKLQDVGFLAGGRIDADELYLFPFESVNGDKLDMSIAMDPETYEVKSTTDPAFQRGIRPTAVYRKSKPLNKAYPNNEQVVRHTLYLDLPSQLQENQRYEVSFGRLNTVPARIPYSHDTRQVRTEAIHTNQIGYRADDPFKRAFLSLWMGDHGAHTFDDFHKFELIDDRGKPVFTGPIKKVLAVDGKDNVRTPKNLSQTAVYALDFSSFKMAGTYRVHVAGIGSSYPVVIADDVWLNSFKQSMHGFLAQRNGIALGPPFTQFKRARTFHPDDGVKVYQSTTTCGQAFNKSLYSSWFEGLVAGRTDEILQGAWGGYNDAGDFDRAANHLWATYLHLELLDLFPDYFEKLKLKLPPDEANDQLPDLFNEALWSLGPFERTQAADGGITAGIESSEHPRKGEDSVRDSLLLMAYRPEPEPSYVYAATAARASRLIKKHDSPRAEELADSALKAFEFAEAAKDDGKGYGSVSRNDARNVAAAELLMLTGEDRFDEIFKKTSQWGKVPHVIEAQGGGFTYARLPAGVGDEELKSQIRDHMKKQADAALQYGDENAFGLTVEVRDLPLIGPVGAFTVPGMNSRILPRVHYLTGEKKYLSGIVRSCHFSAGANPDNRAFTTGIGFEPVVAPLHFDSRFSAQEVPAGLTVYGAYDHDSLPNFTQGTDWVHVWMLPQTMYPASRSWPVTESYVDFFLWPMMNEFTIRQNMGPTSYTWGYLAGRKSLDGKN